MQNQAYGKNRLLKEYLLPLTLRPTTQAVSMIGGGWGGGGGGGGGGGDILQASLCIMSGGENQHVPEFESW